MLENSDVLYRIDNHRLTLRGEQRGGQMVLHYFCTVPKNSLFSYWVKEGPI